MLTTDAFDADKRKEAINTFLLVVGYCLFIFMMQFFLYRAGMLSVYPSNESLRWWDANIYEEIARTGYVAPRFNNASNSGWYILLPWIWRLLHASYMGMCAVNILFFAAGFTIVTLIYPVSIKDKMLWLTTPSLYFMIVPYSEALFCMLTAVSFYGIAKQNRTIIWIGLFLLSLTRATAVFLIPALLIMELLANDNKNVFRTLQTYLINYAFPTLAGLLVFVLVQYHETGIWFAYFQVQYNNMDHKFSMPVLPFIDIYGGQRILWLTALAMLPCIIALLSLTKKCWLWLLKNKRADDRVLILSLVYLPITLLVMIFFDPQWGAGTSLLGLHRYTFCTPFIFVFLYHFCSKPNTYGWKIFVAVFLIANVVWLSVGSYEHIRQWLFYNVLTLLAFGYMLHNNKKTPWATYFLVIFNVFTQIILLQQFMQGQYPD